MSAPTRSRRVLEFEPLPPDPVVIVIPDSAADLVPAPAPTVPASAPTAPASTPVEPTRARRVDGMLVMHVALRSAQVAVLAGIAGVVVSVVVSVLWPVLGFLYGVAAWVVGAGPALGALLVSGLVVARLVRGASAVAGSGRMRPARSWLFTPLAKAQRVVPEPVASRSRRSWLFTPLRQAAPARVERAASPEPKKSWLFAPDRQPAPARPARASRAVPKRPARVTSTPDKAPRVAHSVHGSRAACGVRMPRYDSKVAPGGYAPQCPECVEATRPVPIIQADGTILQV